MNINIYIKALCFRWQLCYYSIVNKYRAYQIRRKPTISVLFVVSELSMWKTESLYVEMLNSQRFNPILLLIPSIKTPHKINDVIEYANQKGYIYETISKDETIQDRFSPDIIFYQQPYENFIPSKYFYDKNLHSLICHVNYCFRNILNKGAINQYLLNIAWHFYAENDICLLEQSRYMINGGRNQIATGLPFMDDLSKPKSDFKDPWKWKDSRKRIIYAPHHSITDGDNVSWGTILRYGDFILECAKRYTHETVWIFKPHPFLRGKLEKIWGVERTNAYYQSWSSMENSQCEEGEYNAIFKHSDAMIHDCGSFSLEYLYTGNPVMYLYDEDRVQHDVPLSELTKKSLDVHYKSYSEGDIERFITDIIKGNDCLKKQRNDFYQAYLYKSPEHSATKQIMRAILGN